MGYGALGVGGSTRFFRPGRKKLRPHLLRLRSVVVLVGKGVLEVITGAGTLCGWPGGAMTVGGLVKLERDDALNVSAVRGTLASSESSGEGAERFSETGIMRVSSIDWPVCTNSLTVCDRLRRRRHIGLR